VAHYWVNMWTFFSKIKKNKKNQKNHEMTCGRHYSLPLTI